MSPLVISQRSNRFARYGALLCVLYHAAGCLSRLFITCVRINAVFRAPLVSVCVYIHQVTINKYYIYIYIYIYIYVCIYRTLYKYGIVSY